MSENLKESRSRDVCEKLPRAAKSDGVRSVYHVCLVYRD